MHRKSLFRPIFAFKSTIFRHVAGYASVALETILLHVTRDLIFSGTTRVVTLYILKQCQRNEDQARADAMAESMRNHDMKSFWKDVSST